jgi:hypothetical protein
MFETPVSVSNTYQITSTVVYMEEEFNIFLVKLQNFLGQF